MIFQTQVRAERYEISEALFNCKMEEHSSISEHVVKMFGYSQRLIALGCPISNELGVDRDPPSYKSFVLNYNMQGT